MPEGPAQHVGDIGVVLHHEDARSPFHRTHGREGPGPPCRRKKLSHGAASQHEVEAPARKEARRSSAAPAEGLRPAQTGAASHRPDRSRDGGVRRLPRRSSLYVGQHGRPRRRRRRGRPPLPHRRGRRPRAAGARRGRGHRRAARHAPVHQAVPGGGNLPAPRAHARARGRLGWASDRGRTRTSRCSTRPTCRRAAGRSASCSTPGSRRLFSEVGAHLLFTFLMIAGVLLITGASIAGVVARAGRGAAATTARVRQAREDLTTALATPAGRTPVRQQDPDHPPEPPGVEPVVHATHVEAPALDAEERYPDLFPPTSSPGAEDDTIDWDAVDDEPDGAVYDGSIDDEDPVADESDADLPEPDQLSLTPMGNERTGVTEADDFDYKLPSANFLKRSKATKGNTKQQTAAIERTGMQLIEALGHFGVDAKVVGSVSGPHVTRYELRLAPGHQDVEGREHARRPRLRAGCRRRAHPRPDPGQARRRRRGAQHPAPDGQPRRRGTGRAGGLLAARRLARQGHRRQGDRHRPRRPAARARGRHHRLGQVRLRERDARVDPHAVDPERGPARARRPQAGRAEPVRADPPPAHPGRHEPAAGRERAPEPDPGDGGALLAHERERGRASSRSSTACARRKASRRSRTSSA